MKKLIRRLLLLLVLLIIAAVIGAHFFLDAAIKNGVETVGPKVTKTGVKLRAFSLSLLSGSTKMSGLVVGNPEGFKTPDAISVGATSIALKPMSLLGDKIIINEINLQAPEVTFETGLDVRANNLSKLLANVEETTGGSGGDKPPDKPAEQPAEPKGAGASRKLQVDEFIISGAKVHVTVTALGGKSATVRIPDIHLKNLGQGPEGITVAELTKQALQALEKAAAEAAVTAIADLSKGAVYISNQGGGAATNTVNSITKGIGDLFKKK